MKDPLSLALEHVNRVDELLEGLRSVAREKSCYIDEKRLKDDLNLHGFTTRMKNFPSLMNEAGVMPALTFYLSKVGAGEEILKSLYLYFKGEKGLEEILQGVLSRIGGTGGNTSGNCNEPLLSDASSKESAGYAIATAMLLSAIDELLDENFDTEGFMRSVAEKLKKFLESPRERFKLEYSLGVYSMEVKKLVEAFSKAKWEVNEQ